MDAVETVNTVEIKDVLAVANCKYIHILQSRRLGRKMKTTSGVYTVRIHT